MKKVLLLILCVTLCCAVLVSCARNTDDNIEATVPPTNESSTESLTQTPTNVPNSDNLEDDSVIAPDWLTAIEEDDSAVWKYEYNGKEYTEIYRMNRYVLNLNHYYSAPYSLVEIDSSEYPSDGEELAYESNDGTVSALLRIADGREFIHYSDNSGENWYEAKVLEGHKGSFVSAAFEAFRNNLGSIKRYKFGGAVDAEYAVESFANFDFGEYLTKELLGERDFTEYQLVSYEIEDSSDTAVVFTIKYLCKPVHYDESTIAGGRLPGEGEYEGWYNCYQQYLLEYNSDDCYWYVTNQGTGGISLPK